MFQEKHFYFCVHNLRFLLQKCFCHSCAFPKLSLRCNFRLLTYMLTVKLNVFWVVEIQVNSNFFLYFFIFLLKVIALLPSYISI